MLSHSKVKLSYWYFSKNLSKWATHKIFVEFAEVDNALPHSASASLLSVAVAKQHFLYTDVLLQEIVRECNIYLIAKFG
ncbi:hypothetical protein EHE19_010360 [Ruminiclostridium herbifermentans]|uniref:Uncharacterized protein n=1 Tax=Ruminiclostridium herbifermentans TaxID=2488810 RepID=A0A7H1VIY1_9FIRM|nr:hypothetical protein EHE19_010360 [Ruminiclostridium herbifermentans]